jgi:predicted MPP superfamily phosphohydrolase
MKSREKIGMLLVGWILFLSIPSILIAQTTTIKGIVFEDINGNLVHDVGEKGIPDVVVSDQVKTTVTDATGTFIFNSESEFPYLVISQPSGYSGDFYSKKAFEMSFPLQKSSNQSTFRFIHASDTHVDTNSLPRIQRFREMADSLKVAFTIITGDLIKDALRVNEATANAYYEMFKKEITQFKAPVYTGVGNHELFGIERDKSLVSAEHPLYGKNMYRHFLGPNYYSFNYGGIHFISIDGVGYQNLYYYGGVDETQLAWLQKDLQYLDAHTPVITFNHIPFVSPGFSFQNFENDPYYGPQLLQQNNKLEHRHIVYNFNEVQDIIGDRPYPLALSGHYHAPQTSTITGSDTQFAQTAAITGPDTFIYNGFKVNSGFTLYEVREGAIISSTFIPLNFN